MKGRRMLLIVAIVVSAVALVLLAWQWDLLPRDVIATGTVQTEDGKTLETRQFYRASRQDAYKSPAPGPLVREAVWEVRLHPRAQSPFRAPTVPPPPPARNRPPPPAPQPEQPAA